MQTDFSRFIFFLPERYVIMKNSSASHQNLFRFAVLVCAALLLAGCCTGPAAAQDSDTAILVFTDWHSHLDTTEKILDAVTAAADAHSLVIVCFNGDSENDKNYGSSVDVSVEVWKEDHQYVTPFMKLVSQLLEKPNVQIVVGLGNHELAINRRSDTTSENLAEYISKFKEHAGPVYNSRVYVVNTDLVWKSASPMDLLYQDGTIRRSVDLQGITFLSVLGPILQEDINYGKGQLYANPNSSVDDIKATLKSQISSIPKQNSCVLLAHSAYYNHRSKALTGMKDYLGHIGLNDPKKSTCLFTGHDHKTGYNTCRYDQSNIRAWMQPDPFGNGVAIVYAKPNGEWYGTSKPSTVVEL